MQNIDINNTDHAEAEEMGRKRATKFNNLQKTKVWNL